MPRCRTWSKFRGISMGLGIAPTRFTVPEFPAENDRAGRNFTPVSLDFLGRTCYNQRSFILFKMLMRTNRGPALHAAERAAPQGCCKQPAMCRTSTTAECRGEPLPGVPVTALRGARFPRRGARNSGGTVERRHLIGASSREFYGVKRFLFLFKTTLSKENLL